MTSVRLHRAGCPLCGGDIHEHLYCSPDRLGFVTGQFWIVRCRTCKMVFTNPRPVDEDLPLCIPPELDATGEQSLQAAGDEPATPTALENWLSAQALSQFDYPRGLRKLTSWRSERVRHALMMHPSFFLPEFIKDGRLLEIGFGRGTELAKLAGLGWTCSGVDRSETACELMRREHGLDVRSGQATKLEFADGTFDVVIARQTLQYVPRPREALAEIRRVLKPSGRLMMTVPNFGSVQSQALGRRWRGLDLPRHLVHFTASTLRRLCEESGLRAERLGAVVTGPQGVFAPMRPSMPSLNKSLQTSWWQSAAVSLPAYAFGPSLGLGDSLYLEAASSG